MRRAVAIGVCIVGFAAACATSDDVGRSTIETDDPNVKPKILGSASISGNLDGWTLTLTNLRSGESQCEPANAAEATNVAGLFQLSARFGPAADLAAGQYTGTATFSVTDATCSGTIGEVTADVQIGIDSVHSSSATGTLRAHFPGSLFVATWNAQQCSPPALDLASCRTLPACPTGAGGSLLCIDGAP